jgi:AcrR family transcriptional regulator
MSTSSPPRGPGRPPRTAEERAAQRTRLVDAAMAAIRAHGPDVSVDEIAAAAGVSKPVLYAEFGDKVGIGEAIAVELGDRGERVVIEEMRRGGGLEMRRALTVAINRFIDIVIDEPEIYAFILRSIRTSDKGLLDNALIRTLEGRFQQLATVLAPDADPDVVHVVAAGTFAQLATILVQGFAATGGPPA